MPATTPRGYPYSIPSDPADVPTAIQNLAEAIDVDVQAREESIHPRPAFRLTGTESVTYASGGPVSKSFAQPFNTQDAMVGAAIDPVTGSVTRIIPRLPGFWWIHGSITWPRAGSAGLIRTFGITLQTGAGILARNCSHIMPPAGDGSNNISVVTGQYFNGTTDYIEMIGTAIYTASVPGGQSMVIRRRYLTAMRMTES